MFFGVAVVWWLLGACEEDERMDAWRRRNWSLEMSRGIWFCVLFGFLSVVWYVLKRLDFVGVMFLLWCRSCDES